MTDDQTKTGGADEAQNPAPAATTGPRASFLSGLSKEPPTTDVAPESAPAAVEDTSETEKARAARMGSPRSLRADPAYMPVVQAGELPTEDYAEIGNWRGLPLYGCQWTILGSGGRCPYSTTEEGDIVTHVKQTHYVRRPNAPLIFGPDGRPVDSGSGRAQS